MVQLQQRKTFKFVMRGSEVRILSAAPVFAIRRRLCNPMSASFPLT